MTQQEKKSSRVEQSAPTALRGAETGEGRTNGGTTAAGGGQWEWGRLVAFSLVAAIIVVAAIVLERCS